MHPIDSKKNIFGYFDKKATIRVYGISQDPDTKDYLIVLQNAYCEQCGTVNIQNNNYKWCEICKLKDLTITNWTSQNERIDYYVQVLQLKCFSNNMLLEWIPYNQFNDIEEIVKTEFVTAYTAIWKDGPLRYNKKEWIRKSNIRVNLYKSQNTIMEFLYAV